MPNTQSAKKRLRQNIIRRTRNRAVKSAMKTQLRRFTEAITAGDFEKAATEFRLTAKKFDKAAAAGVVHKNMAARAKSRLSARLKAARQAAQAAAT